MKRIDEHWEGSHFGADACAGIRPTETCNAVQKRRRRRRRRWQQLMSKLAPPPHAARFQTTYLVLLYDCVRGGGEKRTNTTLLKILSLSLGQGGGDVLLELKSSSRSVNKGVSL
jgi:hypothetical protein